MIERKSLLRVHSALALAGCWSIITTPAEADSIIAGTVTDAITGRPVAGAEVRIEYSGQVVGSGTTDIDGLYQVPFTIPSMEGIVTLVTSASSPSYALNKSNFQVSNGTPIEPAHDIALFPAGVADCRSEFEHSVIVGHFLPPVGSTFSDLPERVAQSLEYTINTRLQTVRLAMELQPSFEACDAAKPRTPRLGKDFARALRAEAFVGGNVAEAPPSFTVSTYVSDAYDLFTAPLVATSTNVDLNNPSGATMAEEIHVAVLAAVASGLARKGDCVATITVVSVAEQVADVTPPYLADLRRDCEARLPNSGLLGAQP